MLDYRAVIKSDTAASLFNVFTFEYNNAMEYIIEYQTTYFNSLKVYINNMTDKNDIIDLQYGDEIPLEYQSNVLKMFNNRVEE